MDLKKVSPIQNEGVINPVLMAFENETGFKLAVEPLDQIKSSLSYFFDFSSSTNLGLVVTPTIQKNFGPFYVCKLRKLPKY